jgi:hypothetical protein
MHGASKEHGTGDDHSDQLQARLSGGKALLSTSAVDPSMLQYAGLAWVSATDRKIKLPFWF